MIGGVIRHKLPHLSGVFPAPCQQALRLLGRCSVFPFCAKNLQWLGWKATVVSLIAFYFYKTEGTIYSILRLMRLGKGIPFSASNKENRRHLHAGYFFVCLFFFCFSGRGNNLKHLRRFPSNKKSDLKFWKFHVSNETTTFTIPFCQIPFCQIPVAQILSPKPPRIWFVPNKNTTK